MLVARTDKLLDGVLIRRYQRFLAVVRLADGMEITAHTPNTGSMIQCAIPGHRVLLSRSDNPSRKLAYTLELVRIGRRWVDINTLRANRVVEEALLGGRIHEFINWKIHREIPLGSSRLDFMLEKEGSRAYIEVKNVTLTCAYRTACFPDAVTERGWKHLKELMEARRSGYRAVILFLVQRSESTAFRPADHIDPTYGQFLRQAIGMGVEAAAYKTRFRKPYIHLADRIPVLID